MDTHVHYPFSPILHNSVNINDYICRCRRIGILYRLKFSFIAS